MIGLSSVSPSQKMLFGATLISFSAVFVKLAQVAPMVSAFYRVFFGFFFLLLVAVSRNQAGVLPRLRRHLSPLALAGFLFALDLYFWHRAIGYIGPGLATLISNFQVFLMTAIGVLFLGDRIRFRFLAALPLAFFGLGLLVGWDWQGMSLDYRAGIILSLLTACCYTAFLLCLRRIQSDHQNSTLITLQGVSFFTALFLAIMMVWDGLSFVIPDAASFLSLLGLGMFSQTLGWLAIADGMGSLRPSLIGLILLLQPSLSFLWDVLFFNRPTSPFNWAGLLITLAALYIGMTAKVTAAEAQSCKGENS